MKYYVELTLLPNLEIPLHFIWEKAFQQIHIALADNKNADGTSDIGVSFPEYDATEFSLGARLRLFAKSEQALSQLQCEKWLERLWDYMQVSSVKPVPESVDSYARFSRWREKGSFERLARRRSRKLSVSYNDALAFFKNQNRRVLSKNNYSQLPYIQMQSLSVDKRFRLFIAREIVPNPVEGQFNAYGLSKFATVPWF